MSIDRREAIKRTALMMGGFVFAPSAMGVLKGCTATPGLEWTPVNFSQSQAHLISELTDVIIPSGDTPGARESGVPAFIEQMVFENYPSGDKEAFLEGLSEFHSLVHREYGINYAELSGEQKFEFAEAQNRSAIEDSHDSRPFFLTIKELTMLGYFTAEAGATGGLLRYEPIPGRYDGCVPLEEIGKAWL
ncbi:MAG: gluconate 2-dehydrogenase subunit 3 family protein [Balneolales bacterium]